MIPNKRHIRSFVRRTGRMTPAQESAMHRLWPRYGIDDADRILDLRAMFGREAPCVLEIGFGNGETLVEQAQHNPETNFLGVEVHEPGIGHCLLLMESQQVDNLRLIRRDGVEVLQQLIADGTLARINLYFPDPWPKKRHHKRRIVNDAFLALAARKLRPGGQLCIATDWADYGAQIDSVIARSAHFANVEQRQHGGDRPLDRPTTKFERRGLARGHGIRDWRLTRA